MTGPAYIAMMPKSPETILRWWSVYCRECGIEEGMAKEDTPWLVKLRDDHNAKMHPDLAHQLQEYTDTTAAYEAGEDVVPGDCWRACLASLLEVPLADVPHFVYLYPVTDDADESDAVRALRAVYGPDWWRESVAWVQQQRPGWTIAAWGWTAGEPWSPFYGYGAEGAPSRVILTAPSPRGAWNHSVLVDAQTGELAHDPFPGGTGVLDGPGDRVALVREDWL